MFPTRTIKRAVAFTQIYILIVFWVESENRFVKLKLSAKGLRVIDKKGIDASFVRNP